MLMKIVNNVKCAFVRIVMIPRDANIEAFVLLMNVMGFPDHKEDMQYLIAMLRMALSWPMVRLSFYIRQVVQCLSWFLLAYFCAFRLQGVHFGQVERLCRVFA